MVTGILANWLILSSVNAAAVMSPGPAFALTVRSAMAYERRACILMTLGLGLGVGIHVALVLGGFSVILAKAQWLYDIIRYAGAAYLFYIGIMAIRAKKPDEASLDKMDAPIMHKYISNFAAFRLGFFGNLFNPKALVFFTAVYAQFVAPGTPVEILILYGATAIFLEFAWFSMVAIVLTDSRIKRRFMRFAYWIERVCGGLLIALGVKLAFTKG